MARPTRVRVKITDRDRGYKQLVAELKKAGKKSFVKVGLLGDDAREDGGLTNTELGLIHEFGAPSIGLPERSFIRSTFDAKQAEWIRLRDRLVGLVYDGKLTIEAALGLLGARASSDIKASITEGAGIEPPNTPQVFMAKLARNRRGFNSTGAPPRVLVDTGQLVRAISWQVVLHGEEQEKVQA